MQNSVWYRGESLTRLLQGVAVGAIATLVIGFGWGGWMLGGSAKTLADNTPAARWSPRHGADLRRPVPT